MSYRERTGPQLPQTLLEQIGDSKAGTSSRPPRAKGGLNRKQQRRQGREESKQRKTAHFARGPAARPGGDDTHSTRSRLSSSTPKRKNERDHNEAPQRKVARVSSTSTDAPSSSSRRSKTTTPSQTAPRPATKPKATTALARLVANNHPRNHAEEHEDAYIAYLEGKLGRAQLRKKEFEEDGLDDLLSGLDALEAALPSRVQGLEEDGENDSDGDEDADEVDEESNEDDDDASGLEEEFDDTNESTNESALSDVDDAEEWGGIQSSEGSSLPRDSQTATASTPDRYIPPQLRNIQNAQDSEEMVKLKRHLKGSLNRLSEQNIGSILDDIEDVYRKNRRNDVTSTLTTLILDGVSSHALLLDSYVVLHASFIASLYRIMGVEFAAYFIQTLVTSYESNYASLRKPAAVQDNETASKECSNLIVLLSELYNFQVISCILVYDIIRALLSDSLTEASVELLLKILRNSGMQLRQDDPSALKDVVEIVQQKMAPERESMTSRMRFMMETLTNLKNNKVKKAAVPGNDAVERMKKFLGGLGKKRHLKSHEPLRVTLADLRSATSKGKWWLVGAAWGGDPLVDRQEQTPGQAASGKEPAGENALLVLAKKQGMNTDIRRSIFVVLMSSDDYVDACERLAQLNLTEVQQREIVRVLLHCCGNEKVFNPYYTLVCQHLCRTSHSYRITLQFCLWDFLRDLGESSVGGAEVVKNLQDDGFGVKKISATRMRNVARAYGWWIAKDCVSLAILKPVDFTMLKDQARGFLRELLVQVLAGTQRASPVLGAADMPETRNRSVIEEVFIKAAKIETLAMGLVYFLTNSFREEESAFVKWAVNVAKETLKAGIDIMPML